jgi:hypothetical protein
MADKDGWQRAYEALVLRGDQRPLATMFRDRAPLPPWMWEHLARMLDPATDPDASDRLIFSRSPRLARKMQTNQDHINLALKFLDLCAEKPQMARKRALAAFAKEHGVHESTLNHSIHLARNLPPFYKNLHRQDKMPPVWGLTAKKRT